MLTHYGSDTKSSQTQMPFLVVLHVSITVVVGSPAKKMCRPVLVAQAAICQQQKDFYVAQYDYECKMCGNFKQTISKYVSETIWVTLWICGTNQKQTKN